MSHVSKASEGRGNHVGYSEEKHVLCTSAVLVRLQTSTTACSGDDHFIVLDS